MKTKLTLISLLFALSLQACCLYPVRYDGPYHGKVVDEQTREPIEGAVVLGTWFVYHFDPGGGSSTYYDARETVSDKNGEFTIRGQGLRILSSLKPMRFTIFKAGYTYFEGSWDTLTTGIYTKEVVKWDGETPVIPIKKLTDEERKKTMTFPPSPPSDAPDEKTGLFMKEIRKERKERGLD